MSLFQPLDKSFCLEQLCAANYQKLFLLCPDLLSFQNEAVGWSAQQAGLQLVILERSPYTLTLKLSHCFADHEAELLVPDVQIRVYLDAQLAEALSDYARVSVRQAFISPALSRNIMDYKWRLNIFLHKWLERCLNKNYRFYATAPLDIER